MATVMTPVFTKAVEEVCGKTVVADESEIPSDEEIADFGNDVSELSKFSAKIKKFSGSAKTKFTRLVSAVANEISYPLMYITAGKNVEPQMTLLNEKLKALAEKTGSTYVDVYDISNECNLDPHPTASGVVVAQKAGTATITAKSRSAKLPSIKKQVFCRQY